MGPSRLGLVEDQDAEGALVTLGLQIFIVSVNLECLRLFLCGSPSTATLTSVSHKEY